MSRVLFVVVCAVACAAAILAPVATAKPLVKICETSSPDVVGGKVVGKLTATNVDPLQAQFATCKQARNVMKRATELGVNAPRPVRSFYCRPTENEKNPARVSYICTFRGADTATFIKLTFAVTYKE